MGAVLVFRLASTLLADSGFDVEISDAVDRWPWSTRPVRRVVRWIEGVSAPFLRVLLATKSIRHSDAVIAMFESQGNSLAMLRALRIRPFTRPRYIVIACWLAADVQRFGRLRKLLYRFAYRGVDRLVYFSTNQGAIFERELKIRPERLCPVPFGIDDDYFEPREAKIATADQYVLAVGRDAGRDWATFLTAVRDSGLRVKLASRSRDLTGLEIPRNVELVGFVDRARYRDLLAGASVVVVCTRDLPYPTGQSVTLESMAMAKCCVVTDTVAMREYVVDGDTALLVPPGDPVALKGAIERASADDVLREKIGRRARARIEAEFNAPLMWHRIAESLEPALSER